MNVALPVYCLSIPTRQASTSFSPNVRESQIQRGGREALLEQTRQDVANAALGPLPGGVEAEAQGKHR